MSVPAFPKSCPVDSLKGHLSQVNISSQGR